MEYLDFRNLVTEACNKMIKENKHLFILDTQKEFLWMAYMESFPEGAVRQEFNCVNCKHFITRYGALVSVDENYKIHSYWEDLPAEENDDELRFSIVKDVINIKLKARKDNINRAQIDARNKRIAELIAKKEDEALENKSIEELRAMIQN